MTTGIGARILGIDPSTVATGWGFFDFRDGEYIAPQSGVLRGSHNDNIDDRLLVMFEGVEAVIQRTRPDVVCVEAAFVGRNMKTALALAKVWGAIIIATKRARLPHQWYTVHEIRHAVTSYGRADKAQVARHVAEIMGDPDQVIQADQADALAVAVCHARRIHAAALGEG
jgi:crossover junction endodeoxyribonuclease RuvC